MTAIVRCHNLVKHYGRPAALVHALRGIDLDIGTGERVALLGRSGSGKSTLLNLLGGLDRPTSGGLQVAGQDLERLSSRQLAHYRLTTVGMIFQSFNLISSRSAVENVGLPMIFAGKGKRERQREATAALEAVGLSKRLHHRPRELSGGEMQRVAIARALVNHPRLLLADEPTGNLDSATARAVLDVLLAHVRAQQMTLILVTHDEELARVTTERVIRLQDGAIVAAEAVAG